MGMADDIEEDDEDVDEDVTAPPVVQYPLVVDELPVM
jgi:hypothetical protein